MEFWAVAGWLLGWTIRLWLLWQAWTFLVVPKLLYPLLRLVRGLRWRPTTASDWVQEAVERFQAMEAPQGALAVGLVMPTAERSCFAGHVNGRASPPPDSDTRFEIGSLTKTFTATLLLCLQRAGHVEWGTTVDSLLPASGQLGRQQPRRITLEDLATHHSGLPRLPWGVAMLAGMYLYPRQPYAWINDRMIGRWLRRRRVHQVGERYRYSNLGFGLLGSLLARCIGTTYGEALRRHILEPLGMHSTTLATGKSPDDSPVAQPHGILGSRTPAWSLSALEAAGGLRSSLADMLRWLRANLERTPPIDADLHAPRTDTNTAGRRIGLGWMIDGSGENAVIWHNGGTGGSRSFMAFMPSRRLGVVVLCSQAVSVDALGVALLRAASQKTIEKGFASNPIAEEPQRSRQSQHA